MVMLGYFLVGRVLVHEAGHLLAAVLVRLPVAAVRLRLFCEPSRVEVSVPARGRWLPVRMILFAAAGPVADLLVAAGAYLGFRSVSGSAARAVVDRGGDPAAVGAAALALLAQYGRSESVPTDADAARLVAVAGSAEVDRRSAPRWRRRSPGPDPARCCAA